MRPALEHPYCTSTSRPNSGPHFACGPRRVHWRTVMTLLDQGRGQTGTSGRWDAGQRQGFARQLGSYLHSDQTNVGDAERIISVAAGSILALTGIARASIPGLVVASVGGVLIYRGATGRCPGY